MWSVWWGRPVLGKAVWCARLSATAFARGVEVFTTFCESHTSQIPFHVVAHFLRAATGVAGLRRSRLLVIDCATSFSVSDPEDLVLLDDLLGIADPDEPLPRIDPDARRRRLTALVNAAAMARESPALYIIEDAHWIDEVSESMLAEFLSVDRADALVGARHLPPRVRGST